MDLIKEFPKYIKSVPCILLNNKTVILSGDEAFKWLNYTLDNLPQQQIPRQQQPQRIEPQKKQQQDKPQEIESFNNYISNDLSNLNGNSTTMSCGNFIAINDFTNAQPLDLSQITTSSKEDDFNIEMERKKQERAEMDKKFDRQQVR
jgi:hypothetical protein